LPILHPEIVLIENHNRYLYRRDRPICIHSVAEYCIRSHGVGRIFILLKADTQAERPIMLPSASGNSSRLHTRVANFGAIYFERMANGWANRLTQLKGWQSAD
jgi:hypothetical protein